MHLKWGPIEVSTSTPTAAETEFLKNRRRRASELAVRVPRLKPPARYRLAVDRIVSEWGAESIERFVDGWPDANGLALTKLLMQADRLSQGGHVDTEALLAKTHAEARIDQRGRVRRKPLRCAD